MFICTSCGKKPNKIAWSRHKKGSSGASGAWAFKAQISKKLQKPNLHTFKGSRYCTKCLREVKTLYSIIKAQSPKIPQAAA